MLCDAAGGSSGGASGARPPRSRSVFRPGLLAGKAAIVSGGGTGIGLAVTRELLELGCNVLICSRSAAKLDAAVAMLRRLKLAGEVHAHACNIRREDEVVTLVETAVRVLGRVDFLVNNGGGQFVSPAEDISGKGFRAVVETNLVGTFLMCREVYRQWMSQHGGAIVNVTMVTENGLPRMSHSGAARAGVTNLTRSLATEWASSGVRINCVAPGIIFTQSGFANYGAMGETMVESITPALPMKRLGTAEEVSAAVTFLLVEGSAYTSGSTIPVDGGLSTVGYPYPLADTGDKCNFPIFGDASVLPPKAKL